MEIPFAKPSITQAEIDAVVEVLRSGWLTTGPRCARFEEEFAHACNSNAGAPAPHAVALNSCTAALHLALEACGIASGDLVLVPTVTFAATAEVVRYLGATPVLVDVRPDTLEMDAAAAARTLESIARGQPVPGLSSQDRNGKPRAIIPVDYGGLPVDAAAFRQLADAHGLVFIEDCAHAFPAQWLDGAGVWQTAGAAADIACFSFYANKTLSTGEGGMAVTRRSEIAERIRLMSLHGLSKDAWRRFQVDGSWDYDIVAPGFKYNMTDIAAALGLVQLGRAQELLQKRRAVVKRYVDGLKAETDLELPQEPSNRRSAWHIFPVRLHVDRAADRATFIQRLRERGVASSVHYRPLHMHSYYRDTFGYRTEDFPVAAREWQRLVSLPLFPDMTDEQVDYVIAAVRGALRG